MNCKHPFILAAMLSMLMQSTWALEPINTTNVKLVNPALVKRDALEVDEVDFSPAQKLKIQTVMQDLDTQVKNAFKGDEALQAEMSAELKKIGALNDDASRSSAIKAYQAKYGKRYQAILAKGNINLGSFASRLNADLPDMQFIATNNLSIKGVNKKGLPSFSKRPNPPSNRASSQVTLDLSHYTDNMTFDDGSYHCGYENTPRIVPSPTYLWISANTAGNLNQCERFVERTARVNVPARTKATMTITGTFKTRVYASVLGFASAHATAVSKIPRASDLPKVELKTSLSVGFLWTDEIEESATAEVVKTMSNTSNESVVMERLVGRVRGNASIEGVGAASSSALPEIENLTVTVKFDPI